MKKLYILTAYAECHKYDLEYMLVYADNEDDAINIAKIGEEDNGIYFSKEQIEKGFHIEEVKLDKESKILDYGYKDE